MVNENNHVLLWKRAETEDVFPWCWAIPWWKVEIEWEEENWNILEQSVIRELEEEVWIEVWECKYLSSHYWFNWWEFKIYIAFKAKHISWNPQALDETEEVEYYSIDEALKLKLAPNVDVLLKQLMKS